MAGFSHLLHCLEQITPDYAEAWPFHAALVAANPHNLVWGN
jgi:hypothetical protein